MLNAEETETKYNGWTNYETWCVALWIDNDELQYRHWRRQAKASLIDAETEPEEHSFTVKELAARYLAGALKSELEDEMPAVEGMWSDLLSAALSEVNWYEIAQHLLEE